MTYLGSCSIFSSVDSSIDLYVLTDMWYFLFALNTGKQFLLKTCHTDPSASLVDPEGVQGVRSNRPLPPPIFKCSMKMNYFSLRETKLFHFHEIFKKN